MSLSTKRKIAGVVGLAGVAWLSAIGAVIINQRKLVFNPSTAPEDEHPHGNEHKTRQVVLYSADGTRLSGWLMTPKTRGPHPAVIYFGGRSEEVSWLTRDAGRMFPGMTVLAVNYRGYGKSLGVPGEQQLVEDAHMVYDWLVSREHVDTTRVAIVGRSLGSGVAVQLACNKPTAALVLLSPYDSISALAKRRFRVLPVNWALRHRFDSAKHASKLMVPTFVLRATKDKVIPHQHTDALVAKLPKLMLDETITDSEHGNLPYLISTQERIAAILQQQFGMVPTEAKEVA